jgi:hypothetical protein
MIALVTRLQKFLVSVLPLIVFACMPAVAACNANPPRGPAAVRIDPAFTAEQRQAIYDAVDAWDEAAGLTVAVAAWDDSSAIPIARDDSIVQERTQLGVTTFNKGDSRLDRIRLAGAGTFKDARQGSVSDYDFQTTAMHELGHLFGLVHDGDEGCDGYGHSNNVNALMYAHGTIDGKRHPITAEDVARVDAIIGKVW